MNLNKGALWRAIVAVLAATSLTVATAACGRPNNETDGTVGTSWADIEAKARAEGALTIYTAVVDAINLPLFEAFNKEYPEIRITHTRIASGELTTRFSSEKESGAPSADLIVIADNLMLSDRPEWFAPLDPDVLPNLVNWNPDFLSERYVHFMAGQFVLTYNTEKLATPPTTWEDLVDPQYKGIGMFNKPGSGGSYTALYNTLRELYGDSYLEQLGQQAAVFYDSSTTAIQQVAAGQYAFNAPSLTAHSADVREAGAPVKVQPLSPAIALTHIGAINADAAHPNAARVYLNWLLSRNGQAAACGKAEYSPLGGYDISTCATTPQDLRIIDTKKAQQSINDINRLLNVE